MARTTVNFSIIGDNRILDACEAMLDALVDESDSFYFLETEREDGEIKVSDESGIETALELAGILNAALKASDFGQYSFSMKGVVDFDSGLFVAFIIDSKDGAVTKKDLMFNVDTSGPTDDWIWEFEDKEDKAYKDLQSKKGKTIAKEDLMYADEDFEVAREALSK